jgi:NADH:ubiquinone oxidoreductase subunit D
MRIVEQALAQIPEGPIRIDDRASCCAPKDQVYGSIEGLMNHFKHRWIEGQKVPAGEVYCATRGRQRRAGVLSGLRRQRPALSRARASAVLLRQAALGDMLKGPWWPTSSPPSGRST